MPGKIYNKIEQNQKRKKKKNDKKKTPPLLAQERVGWYIQFEKKKKIPICQKYYTQKSAFQTRREKNLFLNRREITSKINEN